MDATQNNADEPYTQVAVSGPWPRVEVALMASTRRLGASCTGGIPGKRRRDEPRYGEWDVTAEEQEKRGNRGLAAAVDEVARSYRGQ